MSIDIGRLKVAELKKELGERGLATSGLKKDLAKRLQDAIDAAEKEEQAAPSEIQANVDDEPQHDERVKDIAQEKFAGDEADAPAEVDATRRDAKDSVLERALPPAQVEAPLESSGPSIREEPPLEPAPTPLDASAQVDSADAVLPSEVHAILEQPSPAVSSANATVQMPPILATHEGPMIPVPHESTEPMAATDAPTTDIAIQRSAAPLHDTHRDEQSTTGPGTGHEDTTAGGQALSSEVVSPDEDRKRKRREGSPSPTKRARPEALDLHEPTNNDVSTTHLPDRPVSPSQRALTNMLYIENFTRPLVVPQVKARLVSLAGEELVFFWMNSIRSHCFAEFSSPEGARRARDGMHGRPWPQEKDRKALHAEFVPANEAREWADLEDKEPSKRFYVAVDNGPTAVLCEIDKQPQQAPSQPFPARKDEDVIVLNVDELFPKTQFKPALYYKEASAVANVRE